MKSPELMDLYSDYLLSSPCSVSALTMVKMLNDSYSHDSVTRMLAQPELSQQEYWKQVKKVIRRLESDCGVISVDDSIQHKPHSTENELISWHYDHTSGTSVKGINLVTFVYTNEVTAEMQLKIPLAWELVRKDVCVEKEEKKDGKFITRQVRQASVSKITLVKERLRILVHQNQVKCSYITFDTWYSSADLMKHIVVDMKKHFVCALKDNRLISFDLGEGSEKSKSWIAVSQAKIEPGKVYQVRVKDFPYALHLVKKVYHNLDGSTGVQYLLSSDTTQDDKDIDQTYRKRWSSEDLHRSLKQNTALEKMPAKMPCSQANHIFASMLAQVKLEALKIATKKNHYALKKQILIESLKAAWKCLMELKEDAIEKKFTFPNFKTA
jgi:hypothetical protein